jgi:hypothetical protein
LDASALDHDASAEWLQPRRDLRALEQQLQPAAEPDGDHGRQTSDEIRGRVYRERTMALDAVRLVEHVHGHLGWLSAAVLVHPAIVLRSRTRRAHWAVGTAVGMVTVASGIGAWLYIAYRERLKRGIFLGAPAIGLLFERKEHLAFGAVLLAWAGGAAYVASLRATAATRDPLRVVAFRSFCASAALAIVVALLGTVVAVYKSF